jgi:energy-coupling factor transporter ATP-binding protein EcfA2
LNPGLVAVIGARGSGKTALVELVAAAGFAVSSQLSERSFLRRAQHFLARAESTLSWQSDEKTKSPLDISRFDDFAEWPRVQYLSQQFVDRLCSSDGLADELVAEIQRVVFQAHAPEDREGATDFNELLELRAARARTARLRHKEILGQASGALITERARKDALLQLRKQRDEKRKAVARDKKDLKGLVSKGHESRVKRFEEISVAVDGVRALVDRAKRRQKALLGLQDDVAHRRETIWPREMREKMRTFAVADLTNEQWKIFELEYKGDVDFLLKSELTNVVGELKRLKGPCEGEEVKVAGSGQDKPLVEDDDDLSKQTLFLLTKELERLKALIGLDQLKSRRYRQLSEKIAKEENELQTFEVNVSEAEQADTRIQELVKQRDAAYGGVFQAIVDEQEELEKLYAPLQTNLRSETGTLNKLSFSVRRSVDLVGWATKGEELLDLRKAGPFKGAGALEAEAERFLRKAWETGTAEDVAKAMRSFRETHEKSILAHAPAATSEREAYRLWGSQVGEWLYSTEHIRVNYGVQYEGVRLEQLSPGTRGIVLLLLYLAIDQEDDRPLLIDQPEENLDPKSIFDELVSQFRLAKLRRQIIVVTHNANLVVNTDADQVIVARRVQKHGELPRIRYVSGGLENPEIRKYVCDILEGGTAAFIERARRLRVGLPER